jgi:hypothetical protein
MLSIMVLPKVICVCTVKLCYNQFGYSEHIIIVLLWFVSAWFMLLISRLLQTPLTTKTFVLSQAVHYN